MYGEVFALFFNYSFCFRMCVGLSREASKVSNPTCSRTTTIVAKICVHVVQAYDGGHTLEE